MPSEMPTKPIALGTRADRRASEGSQEGPSTIEAAACCVQVCTPFGCRCVLELPVCP
jgi:hypothetical protein